MNKTRITILLAISLLISTSYVNSAPMDEWESWILEDQQQINCPWEMAKGKQKICIWPGKLTLETDDKGGTFTYFADVYKKSAFIALPGGANHWPSNVTVNNRPAAIVERNNRPHIAVSFGHHAISGRFFWDKRPAKLSIPRNIAVVSLLIDGKRRVVDRRNGQLIFSGKSGGAQKKANDNLSIEVFRLLSDGVPVTLDSRITLSVSGKAREVTFGRVILAGTELLQINSPIPARIDADGTMRAQVTPGEHTIRVLSRFIDPVGPVTTETLTKEWPEFEYISFKSATAIRQAKLSGPVSVDTTQIPIPGDWEEYPTYQMSNGETLDVETEFRGDHAPSANTLNVRRNLWLDFSGKGVTTLDQITGEMHKAWRLNAAAGTTIGRATVDSEAVLITLSEGQEGIEIRSSKIELEAVTRTESASGFSATGWDATADQYIATLHLPPGWRALHAFGVDNIWGTWLSKWDLWDVFLMLITIAATRKLIGNVAAAMAGAAFIVALHEPGSPLLAVPLILVVLALLPVVSGKIKSVLRNLGVLLSAALFVSVIAFAVSAFRLAIYPSLERSEIGVYEQSPLYSSYSSAAPAMLVADDSGHLAGETRDYARAQGAQIEEVTVTASKRTRSLYQITENDRVQTGPGLPTWTWNTVNFRSTGPVSTHQTLSIYYSTPLITAIWRVLSVFLVALYTGSVILRLVRLIQFGGAGTNRSGGTAAVFGMALVLLVGAMGSPQSMAENYPPKYLLDSLEERLTKAADCLPDCASLGNGRITVNSGNLSIRFSVYADADIALPLPFGHGSWALEHVRENGQSLPLRKQQDKFFARVSKGHHVLILTGKITADQANIKLPLAIHNLKVSAPGWVVEGLIDGRARNGTLTFTAAGKSSTKRTDTLKADPAPSFVHVKRHFSFGKKWHVETEVQRISPQQGTISVPIKLVANEKLLQDMGVVKDGGIVVQLGHRQQSISWMSSFEPTTQLHLEASQGSQYLEEWSFTPSSLWRPTYNGIPPIKAERDGNAFEPIFKPWPGETLVVEVKKPAGVPGETHTIESVNLVVDAGSKLQRSTLNLETRSSLGTDYTLTLPDDTEVLSFHIDGRAMNTPSGSEVKIPLQPGPQSVTIEFQSSIEMGLISRSPEVRLPQGATNITVQYSLPRDRWPLYLSGPPIGPAMLYWGVLCVIVLGALTLPHLAKALDFQMPITMTGWLLLGLGLSTVNSYGVLIIAVMFFILAARKQLVKPEGMTPLKFNAMQVIIVGWVGLAACCLVVAIPMGLLSSPEMKVAGNGSGSHFYNYYQDIARGHQGFPTITVISVPIIAYRAVMLLWSLWLSIQLIRWAGWAWECFSEKAIWAEKTVANTGK